jgi:hypothetical protein
MSWEGLEFSPSIIYPKSMVTEAAKLLTTDTPDGAAYTRFSLAKREGRGFYSQSFAIYDDPKYASIVITSRGNITQVAFVTLAEAKEIWARSVKEGLERDGEPYRQARFGAIPAKR